MKNKLFAMMAITLFTGSAFADTFETIRVPKDFNEKLKVEVNIAEELAKGSPDLYRANGIDILYAQNRFFTANTGDGFLTVLGDVSVTQKMNFAFAVDTGTGKKMVLALRVNGAKLPNGGMLPISKKDCYMDVSVLDQNFRTKGSWDNGLCESVVIFTFEKSEN